MQLDNIRVSRKLWGAFLLLMLVMLVISGFQQYRANASMGGAMDSVVEIEDRISAAVRWRGATETAVNMVMGAAVTTDAVLAQQYDAKVKEIIGNINKVQEGHRGPCRGARGKGRARQGAGRAQGGAGRHRQGLGAQRCRRRRGHPAVCRQ